MVTSNLLLCVIMPFCMDSYCERIECFKFNIIFQFHYIGSHKKAKAYQSNQL